MGHTDHPPPGSFGARRHSLVPSLVRHPHNPPQLSSQRLRWGFNPNSTDCDCINFLQFQSLPTTSTHTPGWSFPRAIPTPPKPSVPTQLMRVPGSQRHRCSLLSGTLVASSKLMEGTCRDSNLLLGVSLLFTSPCGSTLRLYPRTHACLRFSSAATALNYTPTMQAPDLRSSQRNWSAHLAEKYLARNPVAFSRTYTLCDTSRQHFELCSSDRPAWVYFMILVTLGLCFKLPCMQASKTTSILLYIQWLVIKCF